MKWVTREKVKVDRVALPWLIRKFIDPQAEFLFVPADQVMEVAKREGATPYDVKVSRLATRQGMLFRCVGREARPDARSGDRYSWLGLSTVQTRTTRSGTSRRSRG
jgi:hypothetical protein